MMAKMFYTMDEAKAALGKSEDEVRLFAREGRLREFRDGPRLMFKADQVEQLRSELGGGVATGDQVDLGMSDSGGLIGLVDTTGASGTSITLSDTEGGSGGSLRMKDDTALAADLGLSGSLGGVPSPGPVRGGMPSGTGLSGNASGRSGVGINVFGTDDSIEHADPMAQTSITSGMARDQIDLQAVGSGSGLLDLTRESDDTSLGAVLDEITPGGSLAGGSMAGGSMAGGSMAGAGSFGSNAFVDDAPVAVRSAAPVFVERDDPLAPAFGGAALGAALVCLFGIFVLSAAMVGTRPAALDLLPGQDHDHQRRHGARLGGPVLRRRPRARPRRQAVSGAGSGRRSNARHHTTRCGTGADPQGSLPSHVLPTGFACSREPVVLPHAGVLPPDSSNSQRVFARRGNRGHSPRRGGVTCSFGLTTIPDVPSPQLAGLSLHRAISAGLPLQLSGALPTLSPRIATGRFVNRPSAVRPVATGSIGTTTKLGLQRPAAHARRANEGFRSAPAPLPGARHAPARRLPPWHGRIVVCSRSRSLSLVGLGTGCGRLGEVRRPEDAADQYDAELQAAQGQVRHRDRQTGHDPAADARRPGTYQENQAALIVNQATRSPS
jgi:hypothetical protein